MQFRSEDRLTLDFSYYPGAATFNMAFILKTQVFALFLDFEGKALV